MVMQLRYLQSYLQKKCCVKKFFITLFALCLLSVIVIFILIPSEIKITKEFVVKARQSTVSRNLFSYEGWNSWLNDYTKAPRFEIQNVVFTNFKKLDENNATLTIYANHKQQHNSTISITNTENNNCIISWNLILPKAINPFTKLNLYWQAQTIKKSIDIVSQRFQTYIEDVKKVYGFATRITTLQDSCMISTKCLTNQYPSVTDIYAKIEKLEQYAAQNNAKITNYPMLNIHKVDDASYSFMVALPINKRLANNAEILYKQMLPNGNFLCSDSIYGGFCKLDNLFNRFENYRKDLNLMSPAIPFQSLITDRRKESDTTKWITKFFYPIF